MSLSLEPLRFERHFVKKVWGGRALATTPGIELPPGQKIGETWEVVDRAGENSVVATGAWKGRTLSELMQAEGQRILGSVPAGKKGRFPLLVKYLDACDDLSVQVHPDDDVAARIGAGAEAKTEAWYVLDARERGSIYVGPRPDVERESFRAAKGRALLETLERIEVRAGDCVLIPGGTVHAIGRGVTILEVQQNSDTTYRLWDWDRVGADGKPRELHVDKGLASVGFGRPLPIIERPAWTEVASGVQHQALTRSPYFAMDAWRLTSARRFETGDQFRMLAVIEGGGSLVGSAGASQLVAAGDVWLLPAACEAVKLAPEPSLRVVELFHHDS